MKLIPRYQVVFVLVVCLLLGAGALAVHGLAVVALALLVAGLCVRELWCPRVRKIAFTVIHYLIVIAVLTAFCIGAQCVYSPAYRYAFYYNKAASNVEVQKRPQNCDFDWSPEGKKGCHYEKSITTFVDENQQRHVVVSWDRVDDE